MDLNLVIICGRVAAEPEIRTFESGSKLIRCLVTTRLEEPKRTDVVPVTLWDPPPETEAITLGDRVWATGTIQRRFWGGADGRKSRLEIIAGQLVRRLEPSLSEEP